MRIISLQLGSEKIRDVLEARSIGRKRCPIQEEIGTRLHDQGLITGAGNGEAKFICENANVPSGNRRRPFAQ